jgi:ketosteroid isomerase-like protein
MDEQNAVEELKAFYADYIANFNRRDIKGVPRFFAFPWATVDAGGAIHRITDPATLAPMWEKIIAELEADKWSHSEVDHLDVVLTGANTGVLGVDFTRWRTDGTVREKRRGFYVVQRNNDGWKIITSWDRPRPSGP